MTSENWHLGPNDPLHQRLTEAGEVVELFWGTGKGNTGVLKYGFPAPCRLCDVDGPWRTTRAGEGKFYAAFTIPTIFLLAYVQLRKAVCVQHTFCIFQYNAPIYMRHEDEKKKWQESRRLLCAKLWDRLEDQRIPVTAENFIPY